jgi:hypothetical protein
MVKRQLPRQSIKDKNNWLGFQKVILCLVFALSCLVALIKGIVDKKWVVIVQQTIIIVCYFTLIVLTHHVHSNTVIYSMLTALVLAQQPLYDDPAVMFGMQTQTLTLVTHVIVY